jgi:phage terminase large subunit-like protein
MNLTPVQENYIDNYVKEIISNLPPKAIQELMSGYGNDLDKLLGEMRRQTAIVTHMDRTLDIEKLEYLSAVEQSMDLSLRKQSYNYFKTVCLPTFRQGWRNLEWGNIVQLYPYNSILASRSSGKCLSPETEIVMADGTIREIKDVSIGDQVMGPDSKPRTVMSLHKGTSRMWKVRQTWGVDYVVNEGHIVCCKKKVPSRYENRQAKDLYWKNFDVPVEEIPLMSGYSQRKIMGYKVKGWDLPEKDLPVDPYLLGLWLGDGLYTEPIITTPDHEIVTYLNDFCEKNGFVLSKHKSNKYTYRIIEREKLFRNRLKSALKDLGVLGNKHIPESYLTASRKQRLELLAGLIDTDGYSQYKKGHPRSKYCFEIGFKNRNLIEQTRRLALSLGFRCNSIITRTADVKVRTSKGEHILHDYTHYRITVSGDVDEIPVLIERKKIPPKETVQDNLATSLEVEYVGEGEYAGFSCDGDHLFLLKDGTVVHNSYEGCFAFILWRLYSYDRPSTFLRESVDNRNRKETCMITNNETLGKKHISMIISEINQNDILREKLNPNMKAKLAATSITTETDSILHLRSKDSMIRGLHVGAVVCDDLPDESALYSQEQREKLHEVFYGSITPIVEPFGYLCVYGTPYASADLYGDLKNDARFKVFEYPAIFPDGQLLAPDRLTFSRLTEERQSLGTLVFNREYLVVPVADTSTIFPYEFLKRSIHGMEHISFTNDIESYPIKLVRVVVGCDFAISGNVGADYTVYTVWGIDSNNLIYLINLYREQGASHDLQVNRLIEFNARYKPNKLVCESNGFQRILAGMAKERGLINIEEFITTEGNKKDLKLGLPSLSALFESGRLRVPYGDENTRKLVDIMFGEFNSIAFNSKKGTLESVCGHDDTCMSSFMAIQDLRENKMVATIDYIDMD